MTNETRPSFLDAAFDEAALAARRSRDPSTKVGAAIYRPDNTLASKGYNGFPRGVRDLDERYADRQKKYLFVVHAEMNALLTAREPLHGYILVSTAFPCASCAGAIIQAGIKQVYAPMPSADILQRWGESFEVAKTMFREAGVAFWFRTEEETLVGASAVAPEPAPQSALPAGLVWKKPHQCWTPKNWIPSWLRLGC